MTTKDSLRESVALDAVHEQAISRPLSHDELIQLQRVAATRPSSNAAPLYIDGLKIARLYCPYFHIQDLSEGEHDISVTLSSNDHSYYYVDGDLIEARTTITQEADEAELN